MLHYYARLFYNKTIISPELDNDIITVYYIQDDLPPFDVSILSINENNGIVKVFNCAYRAKQYCSCLSSSLLKRHSCAIWDKKN